MDDILIPAPHGKRWLQDKLNKSIPKQTLQRWRKAADIELVIDENNQFSYWLADLYLIWQMITVFNELPTKKKTLKNARKIALTRLNEVKHNGSN